MNDKVEQTIIKFSMLEKKDTVLVGISGGADSVALLHLLLNLKDYALNIYACHINHQIRGEEAQRDEEFVKAWCKKIKVHLFVKTANILKRAEQEKKSVEEAARDTRYEIFNDLAKNLKAKIITAHTLNDSMETVMLNIIRGTGLKGLCGIPAVRGNIIRPLIEVTRQEIEEYIDKNQLCFVKDSTNDSFKYKRNRIRHNIIPRFFEINSSFGHVFKRMCDNLAEDEKLICDITEKAFNEARLGANEFRASMIKKMPNSIKFRIIKRILKEVNILCEFKKIDLINKIISAENGKITIADNLFCIVSEDILRIETAKKLNDYFKFEQAVTIPGIYNCCENQIVEFKVISKPEFLKLRTNHNDLKTRVIDFEKLIGKLILRTRKPGDMIKLNKNNCTKTLRKLFNEYRLKFNERERCLILADDKGLVWVNGFGPAKRVAIDKTVKQILIINHKWQSNITEQVASYQK